MKAGEEETSRNLRTILVCPQLHGPDSLNLTSTPSVGWLSQVFWLAGDKQDTVTPEHLGKQNVGALGCLLFGLHDHLLSSPPWWNRAPRKTAELGYIESTQWSHTLSGRLVNVAQRQIEDKKNLGTAQRI